MQSLWRTATSRQCFNSLRPTAARVWASSGATSLRFSSSSSPSSSSSSSSAPEPSIPSRSPNASSTPTSTPSTSTLARAQQKKHKAKKTKSSTSSSISASTTTSVPSLTVASLSPSTPPLSSLLPLGLKTSKATHEDPSDGLVVALTSAEHYDTVALVKSLQSLGLLDRAINLLGEAVYLPQWSPPSLDGHPKETGQIFVFESGTIVSWGLSQAGTEAFLRTVIRGGGNASGPASTASTNASTKVETMLRESRIGWVEQGRYNEFETEVLEYWTGKSQTRMQGDAVHLSGSLMEISSTTSPQSTPSRPSKDLLARLAFSAGIARVTKLGVYEEAFDTFASHVASIPKLLESGSEAPVRKTDIIKRVGTLHGFRQKLNLEDENLLDEPEFLWDDEKLHGYYTSVCKALEFDSRLRNLNDRVDYAFQLQSECLEGSDACGLCNSNLLATGSTTGTLMELLNTKTSHRLEWIIILLIAFEITIVLIREGVGLFHGGGEDEEPRSRQKKVKAEETVVV
ncbi:BQ5605_C024g09787 [Microbotryum silenes-dioicae]|uniref:BQ5605_C024g09787 protein n=1 Tax=Microbotryum silenes-dioicae TaxID=796604 RepID=A0A2X0N7T2_9BASI|nr:BQ5605_C024g09787 [Microbotryum silenes-dioicae]